MPITREPLEPKISLWHFLAFYLRFLREKAGLSLTQCGQIIGAARSTVSNMEAGRQRPHEDQLVKLDEKYGTGKLLQVLLWFARMAHDPDWGRQLVKYEEQAEAIRSYHGHTIPSHLQTEEYMRALVEVGTADDVEAEIAERIARQRTLLVRKKPPFFWLIIDEKALACMVGGRDAMKAQLMYLREMMDLPNVIMRFVQPSAGAHRGFDGPFQVISLDGRDVAYAGAQNGGRLIEGPGEVRDFWTKFEHIGAKALPEDASRALVEQYLEQLT
ncbi:helix-turn-helix domain-containing protein [Actinomadura xylanilytica]|uniref:helix-turn-helix domain-containing protein n=1 Tax=Actinomadura xylanilytica TaxID=887459 RepID=UPI00255AEB52|nr:helix-turn-helix transcriptional regulator [Actinomadura xylanilytica]MDL4774793.1 helix-turn-helix transcriptional regulator [Actinomadura xylanilytica]